MVANGQMADWREWDGLTAEQQKYSLFKILQSMDERLKNIQEQQNQQPTLCAKQIGECMKCFASIKDTKWLVWGIRGIYTFIILGLATKLLAVITGKP